MKETLSLSELENYDPHGLKRGSRWRFLCPLCGDGKPRDKAHRSLSVDGSSGGWKCHRCESQGKLKEFWEDKPMIPKKELQKQALKRKFALAPTTKQPETREIPVWLSESYSKSKSLFGEGITPASEYLQTRGVSWEVACRAGVGYAAEWRAGGATSQRVIFPVNDQSGALVAVQARAIATQFDGPKFISSGPKSLGVFPTSPNALCLPLTFITEAPIDALSLAMCGFDACATLGKDWPAWLPKSLAFRMVGIGYDRDAPGEAAAEKLAASLEAVGAYVFRVRPPEGVKDWNEALSTYGVMSTGAFIAAAVDRARSEFQYSHDFIDNLLVCIRRGIEAGETDKANLRDHKPAIKQKEEWQPAYVCAQCGEALTLELETATTIETILAEGVAMDDTGRVTCGVCLQPQPHTSPNGHRSRTSCFGDVPTSNDWMKS